MRLLRGRAEKFRGKQWKSSVFRGKVVEYWVSPKVYLLGKDSVFEEKLPGHPPSFFFELVNFSLNLVVLD